MTLTDEQKRAWRADGRARSHLVRGRNPDGTSKNSFAYNVGRTIDVFHAHGDYPSAIFWSLVVPCMINGMPFLGPGWAVLNMITMGVVGGHEWFRYQHHRSGGKHRVRLPDGNIAENLKGVAAGNLPTAKNNFLTGVIGKYFSKKPSNVVVVSPGS